jgi:hypothetical protein
MENDKMHTNDTIMPNARQAWKAQNQIASTRANWSHEIYRLNPENGEHKKGLHAATRLQQRQN